MEDERIKQSRELASLTLLIATAETTAAALLESESAVDDDFIADLERLASRARDERAVLVHVAEQSGDSL